MVPKNKRQTLGKFTEKLAVSEAPVQVLIEDQEMADFLEDMFAYSKAMHAKNHNPVMYEAHPPFYQYRDSDNKGQKLRLEFNMDNQEQMAQLVKFLTKNNIEYEALGTMICYMPIEFKNPDDIRKLAVAGFEFPGALHMRLENLML